MLKVGSEKIVHQIYEAAFDPTLWRHIFPTKSNTVLPLPEKSRFHISLREAFRKLGVSEQVISQLPRNEFFSIANIEVDHGVASTLCHNFSIDEFSMHIQQSLQLHLLLLKQQQYASELEVLLNINDRAVFVIDQRKSIIYSNLYAEKLLLKGIISRNQDSLYFSCGANKFEACLSEAVSMSSGNIQDAFLVFDPDNNSYAVRVKRIGLSSGSSVSLRKWVVTILPMSEMDLVPDEEIKKFCVMFGITEAEEKAVSAIVKSIPLHQVAESSNKKGDTVRKQLKSAMNKVGVSSQKQLIQLIERFSYSGA